MKTLTVSIDEGDFVKFGFQHTLMSFGELQEQLRTAYAQEALLKCHRIAQETGLSDMTLDEIQAVRHHAQNRS